MLNRDNDNGSPYDRNGWDNLSPPARVLVMSTILGLCVTCWVLVIALAVWLFG